MKLTAALIMVLAAAGACFADVNIYLYSRADAKPGGLVLSDVALIDGDADAAELVRGIPVDDSLRSDGYLDRKEIIELVKSKVAGRITVYGGGVRVARTEGGGPSSTAAVAVKKGSAVRFQVVNSSVRVEVAGTALKDGNPGDAIPVKLAGRKTVTGTIINEKTVELEL